MEERARRWMSDEREVGVRIESKGWRGLKRRGTSGRWLPQKVIQRLESDMFLKERVAGKGLFYCSVHGTEQNSTIQLLHGINPILE